MTDKAFAFKRPAILTVADDAWVENRIPPGPQPVIKNAKITAKVPEDLRRRIKARCAEKGEFLEDVLFRLLEREFPA
jgi:hypothetical protein